MLNTEEAVLVVVDVQGSLVDIVSRTELVLPNTLKIIRGCQALGLPILATAQVPEKLGPVLPEIKNALEGSEPISKSAFSALREPAFLTELAQTSRKQVLLTGIETHVCVFQTGLDMRDSGYEVYVLGDAVFSRTEENYQLGLARLHDAGAIVSSTEMALFELMRTSRHPAFRTISKLVK